MSFTGHGILIAWDFVALLDPKQILKIMYCTFYYLKGFNSLLLSHLWKLYFIMDTHCVFLGSYWWTVTAFSYCLLAALGNNYGHYPLKQNSDRSNWEKWSTSKGWPVFSKRFWLDRTDPLSFGLKFLEILVEWIVPYVSRLSS